ncbi:MAG: peptidoglycan DD-metalloendopeptidase family protein [bacterium]|nr:peptidoglycan DD-metalloendopeptidase family protein [bacterium]
MLKKLFIYKILHIFTLIILTIPIVVPIATFAQVASLEGQSALFEQGSGQGISSLKTSNLGSNKALELPIPILFGITPDNLVRNFGDMRSGGRKHEGLDIMAPFDALIVTPTDAVVTRIGEGGSAGKYVYTANPGGETFAYFHLNKIADIKEGDDIKRGTLIGYVGNTGNALGGSPHLHFEIRDANGFIDPFSRLTHVFPLPEKMSYLQLILSKSKDEKKMAENIVALYHRELLLAEALNIPLPASIALAINSRSNVTSNTNITTTSSSTLTPVSTSRIGVARTLKIGFKGDDVKALQEALGLMPDGNFGPRTKAAVMAFQIDINLKPDGVFGPVSRLALFGGAITPPVGCTSNMGNSSITGVKCTT